MKLCKTASEFIESNSVLIRTFLNRSNSELNPAETGGEVLMARAYKNSRPLKTAINSDPPAITPQDREDQLIALAVDLAEQRLRDGTASNQLIAEIMKLGTTKERLQKEKWIAFIHFFFCRVCSCGFFFVILYIQWVRQVMRPIHTTLQKENNHQKNNFL